MLNQRIILADRFAAMWRKVRETAGFSQEYMAKALGVSRKTVQNWENGTSCPSQILGLEWFRVCGQQPLPYYLELLFPDEVGQLSSDLSDQQIDTALLAVIDSLPIESKKKLLYLFAGNHGSSPSCVLDMVTAHLQVPLSNRLTIAETIYSNYDMAAATGSLRDAGSIQPNTATLKKSIDYARNALKEGRDDYSTVGGDL